MVETVQDNIVYIVIIIVIIIVLLIYRKSHRASEDDTLELLAPRIVSDGIVTLISSIYDINENARCPYCISNIKDTFYELGGVVKCNKCGTFHHVQCYYFNNKCGSLTCYQNSSNRSLVYDTLDFGPTQIIRDSNFSLITTIEDINEEAKCPICQSNIKNTFIEYGGIIRCKKCNVFYHKDCYGQLNNKCTSDICKQNN